MEYRAQCYAKHFGDANHASNPILKLMQPPQPFDTEDLMAYPNNENLNQARGGAEKAQARSMIFLYSIPMRTTFVAAHLVSVRQQQSAGGNNHDK